MTILIDYGHGKDTPGKRSPWSANKVKPALDFYEWSWNREIGKEIVKILKGLGYDAREVVTENKDISLQERVFRINRVCEVEGKSNVLLVSIHSNAVGLGKTWENGRGWSAYTTIGKTKSDALSEAMYTEAEKVWNGVGGLKVRKDMKDGDRDWESDFYILKHSLCPAVLSENFFYDNIEDCEYILGDLGKKTIVRVHVLGIIRYMEGL